MFRCSITFDSVIRDGSAVDSVRRKIDSCEEEGILFASYEIDCPDKWSPNSPGDS